MKTFSGILAIGLAGSLSIGVLDAPADTAVSVGVGVQINSAADFYEPLNPYGTWVEVGSYGRCWRPTRISFGWRPYCAGHWIWTDCGWYWASAEPWAWATYHYGSWVYDSGFGWVWVPGVEWAPSWVYWRYGGGHIGWAPCAPHGVIVAPSLYVFVSDSHFHHRHRPSTVIVNDATIIRNTTEITQIRRETRNIGGAGPHRVVVNNGPGVEPVQRATGQRVTPVSVETADRETPLPDSMKNRRGAFRNREESPTVQEQPTTTPDQRQPVERMDRGRKGPTRTWQQPDVTPTPERTIAPQQTQPGVTPAPSQPQDQLRPDGRSDERMAPSQQPPVHPQTPERLAPQQPRRSAPQYYPGRWPVARRNTPPPRAQQPPEQQFAPVPPAQGVPPQAPPQPGKDEEKDRNDR
jgi:hypothetical protein